MFPVQDLVVPSVQHNRFGAAAYCWHGLIGEPVCLPLSLSLSLSLSLYLSLSVFVPVPVSVSVSFACGLCLCLCLCLCLGVQSFVCLPARLPACYLPACLCLCLSIPPPVCLPDCLSVSLPVPICASVCLSAYWPAATQGMHWPWLTSAIMPCAVMSAPCISMGLCASALAEL